MFLWSRKSRTEKLVEALESGSIESFLKKLNQGAKADEQLSAEDACLIASEAIKLGEHKALALLFQSSLKPELSLAQQNQLLFMALSSTANTLELVATLLAGGLKSEQDPLSFIISTADAQQRMLLLSRFIQYGWKLEGRDDLVTQTLLLEDKALLQFLISSGCPLPDPLPTDDPELTTFANRCAEDYRIRQAFHSR